jgi:hypothetical protein
MRTHRELGDKETPVLAEMHIRSDFRLKRDAVQ